MEKFSFYKWGKIERRINYFSFLVCCIKLKWIFLSGFLIDFWQIRNKFVLVDGLIFLIFFRGNFTSRGLMKISTFYLASTFFSTQKWKLAWDL
jgi:hypothetical protein